MRVFAASILGLGAPGLVSCKRPFLTACLGQTRKDTEPADYVTEDDTGLMRPSVQECPWRFVETLTFSVRLEDVLGPGLVLDLRIRNNITVGPLQIELKPEG